MTRSNHSHPDRRQFVTRILPAVGMAAALPGSLSAAGQTSAHSAVLPDDPPQRQPLRLGLVSAATYGRPGQQRTLGSHHGTAFATIFNGWDEQKAAAFTGTFVKSARRLESARVVKVWDPDPEAARALAAACHIETVAETPEACCQDVDAAILIDDGSGRQWQYAEYPLRQGVPVFCDKPLAMTAAEAAAVAQLARQTGTKLMSASSLRFVPDIVKLKDEVQQIGPVRLAVASGPGELIYYGIHALSMVYAVLGPGVKSVLHVGRPDGHLVRLRYHQDLDVMLMVTPGQRAAMGFQLQLFGAAGQRSVVPDLTDLYVYLLQTFLDDVLLDQETVPIEEEVELITTLEAAQRSLEWGREVALTEL